MKTTVLSISITPKLLDTHGIMLNSERPKREAWNHVYPQNREAWYESDREILRGDAMGNSRSFRGVTFVDGSCAACNEDSELIQCGWAVVCIEDLLHSSQNNDEDNPDDDLPRCNCRLSSIPYHTCGSHCAEHSN